MKELAQQVPPSELINVVTTSAFDAPARLSERRSFSTLKYSELPSAFETVNNTMK